MSMMNRRNAAVGWATWKIFKRLLKRKARSAVVSVEEAIGVEQLVDLPERTKKRRRRGKRRVLGFLVASAIGVGTWLGARRSKERSGVE